MKSLYSFLFFLTVGLITIGAMFGLLVGYTKWEQSIFHEGYERGARQTAWYVHRTQPETRGIVRYPSQAWRDCAWRFVDKSEDTGFIEVCENPSKKLARKSSWGWAK